jgi:hypothetical protein
MRQLNIPYGMTNHNHIVKQREELESNRRDYQHQVEWTNLIPATRGGMWERRGEWESRVDYNNLTCPFSQLEVGCFGCVFICRNHT